MTNPLVSFNPEKAKCSICEEYFDKSALQNSRMPPGRAFRNWCDFGKVIITGLFCKCCLSKIEEGEARAWVERIVGRSD